ncbi:Tetratricopeptide repeat-containing protein [Thermomonospora echinospora]|uniref:Tetratricopeptide repeat-containing protein n=1 Tax=Thermomonospora echinospora TaxID=1992 RepID=A0A1H6DB38_9ACTN|nr:tetratricopeptide repeat protein [Thermomonospora echinospora]SEG82647.1 Tetratricopeptide repeat-containing protein [Thermomonospora echinospora]
MAAETNGSPETENEADLGGTGNGTGATRGHDNALPAEVTPDERPGRESQEREPPEREDGRWRKLAPWGGVLVTVIGLVSAVVGIPGAWPAFWQVLPFTDPPPLNGAVNIVVSPIAIDAPKKTDKDHKTARQFGDALLAMVQDEIAEPGRIEVGPAADDDVGVYRTEAGRAERLGRDLSSRGGHIAISGTLIPGTVDRLRVEVYLDRNKLDEAYQLGGLQPMSTADFGDISTNPAARRNAQDFLLRKARLYARLLVAVGEYAAGGEQGLDKSIKAMRALQPQLSGTAERSFGWLLIGNAEARAKRRDEAVRAYRKALEADPDSIRAELGLAEIAYLRAGGTFSGEMCTPRVSRVPVLRRLERQYQDLTAGLGDDRHDLRPRVQFALARTRLCLLLVRGKGPIEQIEDGFLATAATWEDDTRKTWLRTLTADAYAMLGETSMLRLVDRGPDPVTAARYFRAAAETAPDTERRTAYRDRYHELTRR